MTELESAVCRIQRAYRLHRLRLVIRSLRESDPWLFDWTPNVLTVDELKRKFSHRPFFDNISQFFYLISQGFRDCHKYYAKLFLIAYMLNHDRRKTSPLTKRIQTLGYAFLSACEDPSDMFTKIRFMDAYSCYYQGFLDSKCKDTAKMVQPVLNELAKCVSEYGKSQSSRSPSTFRCDSCIEKLRSTTDLYITILSALVGSKAHAQRLVRLEMAKGFILAQLAPLSEPNEDKSCYGAKDMVCRAKALQLMLDPNTESVRISSREEKYDGQRYSKCSVMRSPCHIKHNYVKQLIRCNFHSAKCSKVELYDPCRIVKCEPSTSQECWIPSFITHIKGVLGVMNQKLDVDEQCIAQQCAHNCYNPASLVDRVLTLMANVNIDSDKVAEIRQSFDTYGCTQSILFRILDRLDHMRVTYLDSCYMSCKSDMIERSSQCELGYFISDLSSNTCGVGGLLKWIDNAHAGTDGNILTRFKMQFAANMASFPSPSHLDSFPETFRLLRLPILRNLIKVRDTVLAFTLVHFVVNISGELGDIGRLKKRIMEILSTDVYVSQSEMVLRLCDAITMERPLLSGDDLRVLRGLVSKVIRKPSIASEKVPSLALARIRAAIEQRLLDQPKSGPCLEYFSDEVESIVTTAKGLWDLSLKVYQPIYSAVLDGDAFWESCAMVVSGDPPQSTTAASTPPVASSTSQSPLLTSSASIHASPADHPGQV